MGNNQPRASEQARAVGHRATELGCRLDDAEDPGIRQLIAECSAKGVALADLPLEEVVNF